MVQDRIRDMLDLIGEADYKLEHISETMRFAMEAIDSGPGRNDATAVSALHLLGVLQDSIYSTRALLDEACTAATLSIPQPA